MIDWEKIITVGGSLLGGGGLATLLAFLANRRKNNADGRAVEIKGELQIVDSAVALVQTMQSDIDRLNRRLEQVEARNQKLDARIEGLENENQALEKRVHELTRTNMTLVAQLDDLRAQNTDLAARCKALEEENKRLAPGAPPSVNAG